MKTLKLIFNEQMLGILMIGMLAIATVYVYTESSTIQLLGLYYGILVSSVFVGFLIRTMIEAVIYLCSYIKSKSS